MMKKLFAAGAVFAAGVAAAELVRKDREIETLKKRVDRLEEKSEWLDLDDELSDDDDDDSWIDEAEKHSEKKKQEDDSRLADDDFTLTDGDLKKIDEMMSDKEGEKSIPIDLPEEDVLPPDDMPGNDSPEPQEDLPEGLQIRASVKKASQCPDRKTLRQDFKNAGSQKRLAEIYGVHPCTIRRWLDKRGIPRRVEELT